MWTGFAPERLHLEKMTVMEMICASPCVTTLICMSMEARHRSEGTTLDEKAHCARHRLGARGNALTFPLPWEDVLRNLQAHDAQAEAARNPPQEGPGDEANEGPAQLPRAGQDLASTVRVLLKTNQTGKASDAEIKTLLRQATVRREVVVQLILDMKKSGHPSFQHCQEGPVRRAAARLPQEGVPPEVLKVINDVNEEDETGHKLQSQKAATPSDGRETDIQRAGQVFANQRARGVVPEGCSQDREDQNAVAAAALNDLEDQLRPTHEASCQTLQRQRLRGPVPAALLRHGLLLLLQARRRLPGRPEHQDGRRKPERAAGEKKSEKPDGAPGGHPRLGARHAASSGDPVPPRLDLRLHPLELHLPDHGQHPEERLHVRCDGREQPTQETDAARDPGRHEADPAGAAQRPIPGQQQRGQSRERRPDEATPRPGIVPVGAQGRREVASVQVTSLPRHSQRATIHQHVTVWRAIFSQRIHGGIGPHRRINKPTKPACIQRQALQYIWKPHPERHTQRT